MAMNEYIKTNLYNEHVVAGVGK